MMELPAAMTACLRVLDPGMGELAICVASESALLGCPKGAE
jgi:hypothetical protein